MGVFNGQMPAFRHPAKVLSLTLCDMACVMPPKSLWYKRIETARNAGVEVLVPGTLERWITPRFHKKRAEQQLKVRNMILALVSMAILPVLKLFATCPCAELWLLHEILKIVDKKERQ